MNVNVIDYVSPHIPAMQDRDVVMVSVGLDGKAVVTAYESKAKALRQADRLSLEHQSAYVVCCYQARRVVYLPGGHVLGDVR